MTMMAETTEKQKRSSISEEDISAVLQMYSPETVLALLQEMAQRPAVKIDWSELVKNTCTGISSAREYQMLWRHVAYRHGLFEKMEDDAEPLEDESDLECELEPSPAVGTESLAVAAACVKVMIASGPPSNGSVPTSATVEAPLTISLPHCRSSSGDIQENPKATTSMPRSSYITVPVSVQRQPVHVPAEKLDANRLGGGNVASKRKRKPWSEAEDMELVAAIHKYGYGNWANIVRDFMGDRTASQLSQRWSVLRKRHKNSSVGVYSTALQLSKAQLAARHAMSVAIDMPVKSLTSARTIPPVQLESQSQQGLNLAQPYQTGSLTSATKTRTITSKKVLPKPIFSSDSMVRATAVAAGARIASPSDAASLLKAAQAKNAVHIMPKSSCSIKSQTSLMRTSLQTIQSNPSMQEANTIVVNEEARVSEACVPVDTVIEIVVIEKPNSVKGEDDNDHRAVCGNGIEERKNTNDDLSIESCVKNLK